MTFHFYHNILVRAPIISRESNFTKGLVLDADLCVRLIKQFSNHMQLWPRQFGIYWWLFS